MRPLLPRARPRLSPGLCRLRPESNRPVSWSAPLRPKPRRYWENLRQRGSGPPLMTDGLPTGGMSQLTDGPPMLRGSLAWLPVRRVALRCKTRAHPNAAFGRARTVAPWPRGERSGANARAATAIVTERAADHTRTRMCTGASARVAAGRAAERARMAGGIKCSGRGRAYRAGRRGGAPQAAPCGHLTRTRT